VILAKTVRHVRFLSETSRAPACRLSIQGGRARSVSRISRDHAVGVPREWHQETYDAYDPEQPQSSGQRRAWRDRARVRLDRRPCRGGHCHLGDHRTVAVVIVTSVTTSGASLAGAFATIAGALPLSPGETTGRHRVPRSIRARFTDARFTDARFTDARFTDARFTGAPVH
jgi:hypothetical protein